MIISPHQTILTYLGKTCKDVQPTGVPVMSKSGPWDPCVYWLYLSLCVQCAWVETLEPQDEGLEWQMWENISLCQMLDIALFETGIFDPWKPYLQKSKCKKSEHSGISY